MSESNGTDNHELGRYEGDGRDFRTFPADDRDTAFPLSENGRDALDADTLWNVQYEDSGGDSAGDGRHGDRVRGRLRRRRGRGPRRAPRRLKPRPRQLRVGREGLLFDYEGREKGGVYGALVPVVTGYIIPGILLAGLIALLFYGLIFSSMASGILGDMPELYMDDVMGGAADPNVFGGEAMDRFMQENMPFIAAFFLVTFALAIPFLLLFTRHAEQRKFRTLGLRGKGMGGKFLLGALGGALASMIPFFAGAVALRAPLSFNPAIGLRWEWVLPQLLALCFFCLQGSFEELFFRGWSFTTLGKRFGRWRAVVVSSLVFGSLHFMLSVDSLLNVVNAFSLGIFFCVLSMHTGDIAMACGFHAIWNYFQITLLTGLGQGGWFVAGAAMESEAIYGYITIAWSALLAVLAVLFYSRKVRRDRGPGDAASPPPADGLQISAYSQN